MDFFYHAFDGIIAPIGVAAIVALVTWGIKRNDKQHDLNVRQLTRIETQVENIATWARNHEEDHQREQTISMGDGK